jgi:hypothetical protein
MIKKFTGVLFLLLISLSLKVAAADELREIPLAVQSMTGCYIQNGKIKLHKSIPAQVGAQALVLECETGKQLLFQEDVFARKAGGKVNELIQIKQSADEYTPQKSSLAAGGKYIDYCVQAKYQFNINTSGKYYIWVRHWVPFKANWSYHLQLDDDKHNVSISKFIPAAKTWFWVKAFSRKLTKGNHSLRVSELRNGKRMDQIILTLDDKLKPGEKAFTATTAQAVTEGTVKFKPILPVGLKAWKRLAYKVKGGKGYQFFISTDNGSSWQPLNNNDLSKIAQAGNRSLAVKLNITRTNGLAPELSAVKAFYSFDNDSFITLENRYIQLLFSRKTGGISGIVNKLTGRAVQPVGIDTKMFDLLLKEPGKSKRQWVGHQDALLLSAKHLGKDKIRLTWQIKQQKIKVIFDVSLTGNELTKWDVTIINNSDKLDVIEVEAPKLAELRISASPENDSLAWPFSAGEFVRNPAVKGELSTAYPDHAGLPYVDLYNNKEGLYLGCHDPLLVATHFISKANAGQNAIELSINRKHRIRPGSSQVYHFALATHAGDWHKGAQFYRNYFYSRYPVNSYAPWLRKSDAWMVGGSTGHGGRGNLAKDYSVMIKDFKRASFYSLPYIQAWGSTFNGACPTFYLPRSDKGGEAMFKQMIKQWRDASGQIGYYFHGNSVSPYYLLSDKYFAVKWSEYPEKYHPPTWDWYVKNREYTSVNSIANKNKQLKQTAILNKMHIDMPKLKHGNQEERLTGYMPMSWHSNAFPDYLEKWVSIYVKQYKCNTAYLDTFAFRNDRADFNPHLKLHGEGDKPMYKMAFLKKLMADMRRAEPDFCALTEGVGDVFGTKLYFLLSGFARQPNMFRYTLPDQIFFQGSCNAQWTKPLTRKNITQAFLLGNRFDLVSIFPHTYYMLRLRQRVSPFLNYAVFDDTTGITVTEPSIEAYSHITLPSTDKYIANFGTKAVALTIANRQLKAGQLTYTIPDGFTPRYGYVCQLYKEPVKLSFTQKANKITFKVPLAEMACVILVDKLRGPHRWTATIEQPTQGTFTAKIFNCLSRSVTYKINAKYATGQLVEPEKSIEIPGGTMRSVKFRDKSGNAGFKLVNVKISSPEFSNDYIISLGNSGRRIPNPGNYTPPKPKVSKRKQPVKPTQAMQLLKLDFESDEYAEDNAFAGKRCLKLTGNGKYKQHKIPLTLEKNCTYRISLAQRKGFDVSPVGHHNNVIVANYTADKKLQIYLNLPLASRDNRWHLLSGEFTTTDNLNNCGLYFYNKNTKDSIWIDEVKIEKL